MQWKVILNLMLCHRCRTWLDSLPVEPSESFQTARCCCDTRASAQWGRCAKNKPETEHISPRVSLCVGCTANAVVWYFGIFWGESIKGQARCALSMSALVIVPFKFASFQMCTCTVFKWKCQVSGCPSSLHTWLVIGVEIVKGRI